MIYFIRAKQSGRVKIGYTGGDGASRLAQLQTGSPEQLELLATIDGGLDVEKRFHELFDKCRVHGEWFQPTWQFRQALQWLQAGAPVCGGKPIRSVYLAGKITGTTWRNEIAPRWDSAICDSGNDSWSDVRLSVPVSAVCGLVYSVACTGPFCSRPGEHDSQPPPTPGDHACGEYRLLHSRCASEPLVELTFTDRPWVVEQARAAIDASDMVFAWIDSPDCYGTLIEIGYAIGLGKVVRVGMKNSADLDQLWFARHLAHAVVRDRPRDAWAASWREVQPEPTANEHQTHTPF